MNRVIVWIAIALVLGGCAFGRTYSYGDASMGMPGLASGSGTVALAVHDVRPYVVSGNKPERFVGLMRGGFGNPFDVNTGSGDALSNDLRRVISKALQSKGYKVTDVLVRPTETPAAARRRARYAWPRRPP